MRDSIGSATCISDDLAITNILADLKHYCDCKGLAFGKLQRAAYAFYLEEKAYEATWPTILMCVDEVRHGQPKQEGATNINITKNQARRN